jgi:hypothetical protein
MKSLALFIFFLFSMPAAAQEICELRSAAAPSLLNLRIGMTPEQTQSVFGRSLRIRIKGRGERTFFENFIEKRPPQILNGVRALYLRYFDGRLYQIEIFYEPRQDMQTLADITRVLSLQLNFPLTVWTFTHNRAEAVCGEISLVTDNILNPRIELTDVNVREQILETRKKK